MFNRFRWAIPDDLRYIRNKTATMTPYDVIHVGSVDFFTLMDWWWQLGLSLVIYWANRQWVIYNACWITGCGPHLDLTSPRPDTIILSTSTSIKWYLRLHYETVAIYFYYISLGDYNCILIFPRAFSYISGAYPRNFPCCSSSRFLYFPLDSCDYKQFRNCRQK